MLVFPYKKKIYFLEDPVTKFIKIGITEQYNILDRISIIQNFLRRKHGNSNLTVKLLRVEESTGPSYKDELALHRRFKEYNINSEWFYPGPKLLKYISKDKIGISVGVTNVIPYADLDLFKCWNYYHSAVVGSDGMFYGSEKVFRLDYKIMINKSIIPEVTVCYHYRDWKTIGNKDLSKKFGVRLVDCEKVGVNSMKKLTKMLNFVGNKLVNNNELYEYKEGDNQLTYSS